MNIRPLTLDDYKVAGKIIGASFAGDPVNDFLLGPQSAITAYNTHIAKILYLKKGFGHISENNSGCTLWLPPGVSAQLSLSQMLPVVPALVRHSGLKRLIRALPAEDEIAHHRPSEPFYYLYAIGNTPENIGKGIGGKLLKAGLDIADKNAMPVYLECSKKENILFYRKYGFEVIGECTPVKGCPPEWLMLRPTQ